MVTGAGGFVGARISTSGVGSTSSARFPMDFPPILMKPLCVLDCPGKAGRHRPYRSSFQYSYCGQPSEESLAAKSCCPNGLQKRLLKPEQSCWRSAPIRYDAGCKRSGPLSETLSLAPANVYGCHKLGAEQRVLAITPGAYIAGAAGCMISGLSAPHPGQPAAKPAECAKTGTALHFSEQDFRGVSYVTGSH